MRVFLKDKGAFKLEAWVEDWNSKENEWEVVSRSKCLIVGKKVMIDTLDTPIRFRNKGYATAIVKELQRHFSEVEPIGVTLNGKRFWDKLGMKDALGEEK